jgi:hypothetical protein
MRKSYQGRGGNVIENEANYVSLACEVDYVSVKFSGGCTIFFCGDVSFLGHSSLFVTLVWFDHHGIHGYETNSKAAYLPTSYPGYGW